jgi:hypothetical protein
MTQEQLYIKLLQNEKVCSDEIPKEFLIDFQFCKIALERVGIDKFAEEQQREMNLQAVEMHLHASKWICLKYDIDEMVKLVPENVSGNLDLYNSQIKELPQLKSVEGYLNLHDSQIKEFPQLKSVGGSLSLRNSQIKEFPQLKSIGGSLSLRNSQIKEFPQLEKVEYEIFANREDLQYWKDYFTQTNRLHLAEKVTH